jgi:hypothetical protein
MLFFLEIFERRLFIAANFHENRNAETLMSCKLDKHGLHSTSLFEVFMRLTFNCWFNASSFDEFESDISKLAFC